MLPDKFATGKIGIYYLKRIWALYKNKSNEGAADDIMKAEWSFFLAVINTLGLGLEPTLTRLYNSSPSFEEFENWIMEHGEVSAEMIAHFNAVVRKDQDVELSTSLKEKGALTLSAEDLAHWEKNGYVIIRNAISQEQCEASRAVVYDYIEAMEGDPNSWYKDHPMRKGIMVQLFNNEILNRNRFSEKIKTAYYQLWNRSDLLVSMDRVSFNPPETSSYKFPGPNLHWDVSLKQPIPFGLQGLLYLTDTTAEQGAFTLIPGFQNKIKSWLNELPEGVNPRTFDFQKLNPKPIAANSGDFIIWHQALPHGSCPNRALSPRIVQYINYQPIEMEIQEEWI